MGILQQLAKIGQGAKAKAQSVAVPAQEIMAQKMSALHSLNSGGIQKDGAMKAVKEKIKTRRKAKKAPKKEDKAAKAVSALQGMKKK